VVLRGSLGVIAISGLASSGCGLDLTGELVVADDAGSPPMGHDDGGGKKPPPPPTDASDSDDGDDSSFLASEAGAACDFTGTWATKITIAVSWVPQGLMGVILAPGMGAIEQWIVSNRVQTGLATVDTANVCGIALPDFEGTMYVGGENYGVRFPNSLFDKPFLPAFAIPGMLGDSTPHASFATSATAVLIGMTLANAATATWPATVTTQVDSDMDGETGVSVGDATGPLPNSPSEVYSDIPVDISNRTNHLDIVIRQVTRLTGTASDCDHISGSVTIPRIPNTASGKFAIDSHVIGCDLVAGTKCSQSQINFVDTTQPVFSPSGTTEFTSVRMPGATCPMVRQLLP
jgi:hypothetical protein